MAEVRIPATKRFKLVSGAVILGGALAIALLGARPYAASWNDGSRLATVEALVDYHTLAIDESIFARENAAVYPGGPSPYPLDDPNLQAGTKDKLFIQGHYYSDKSPVPALLMAGLYQVWQWLGGPAARERPDLFCYWLTVATSGLAYVVAVFCIWIMGGKLGLPAGWQLVLTGSFALGTVALPYTRHVNNHLLFLGVAAPIFVILASGWERPAGGSAWPRLVALGSLAGLGYTIDLAAGPMLVLLLTLLVVYRCRHVGLTAAFGLGVLPWVTAHHAVNLATGGTWVPANMVAAYFNWPGSPFGPENLTGARGFDGRHFPAYAVQLLVGKQGFLGHNLPLVLLLPGLVVAARRHLAERAEGLFAVAWFAGTWLLYAATSNNYSGLCCSIRWFVPLLAPGFYLLALLLREVPSYRPVLAVVSGWGLVLGLLMWGDGPWRHHMVPGYWFVFGAALVSGWAWRRHQLHANQAGCGVERPEAPAARAA